MEPESTDVHLAAPQAEARTSAEVELPPLPKPASSPEFLVRPSDLQYTPHNMREYAREAVLAERRRCEELCNVAAIPLKDQQENSNG